ncbi:MAG: hypothetical protein H7068_00420 [Pedobacter sp.]|nr:hypothetical protein [Chitinophagaceae bacterium]
MAYKNDSFYTFLPLKIVAVVSLLAIVSTNIHAQPKKIYLANDDHTDYMWSGDEETYKNAFLETLDYYIKLNDSTANLPYNQQSKWNCDGSFWVYIYQQNRSKAQFDKLIAQIKRGQITVPLNTLIVLLGAAPAEASLRNMYYAGSLKRQYGLDLNLVLNMEDQVLPLGLSSLWAGAGGKYSWRGVCACASKVTGLESRKNQMYWYRGLDDQKVLMKWYAVNPSMITNRKEYRYNLGNYLEASNINNAIIDCKALMQQPIYPYNISAAFGKGGDDLYCGNIHIKVIDKTNQQEIPFQTILKNGKSYLRIWASDLPSLGYKVFEIQKNFNPFASGSSLSVTDSTIANQFYKIKFTKRGVITSLIEKISNKQYVKPFDKLYFNDLGSGLANDDGQVTIENQGDVSVTVSAFSYKPIKHTTKITLFANSKRIEIENYITQNTGEKPIAYSFSLNLEKSNTWHEEAGAILHATSISKGGHYADSANRLDWLALNHLADMSDAQNGMVISNRDAYFMKIGNSTITKLDDTSAQIKILATGRIDPYLGIENQDGDSYFENFLALQPHIGRFNSSEAMRFSLQHQNPLIAQKITGGQSYNGKQFSMFSVSDPNVMVWALKPAEEGICKGIIMRVWNLADIDKPINISANAPLAKAFNITSIETDDQSAPTDQGKLKIIIGHNKMQTFRLFIK